MGRSKEATGASHLRRRAMVELHMLGTGHFVRPSALTRYLNRLGFKANDNSTTADLRWLRHHGIELRDVSNPAQQAVDEEIQRWKEKQPQS